MMTAKPRVKRLFIANRGEIARRIALTAKRLGIETVALTDLSAPPVYLLEAVTELRKVPEENPALYLHMETMLAAAKAAGCDSVHPGFGFLSENAGFAAACAAAGLTWVGPSAKAIDAMASKATARGYAEKAQVPCVRGLAGFKVPASLTGDSAVWQKLESFAKETGYPLLMKAAMGGGGKGMRLVHELSELRPAALRAASEAQNSFGDATLICEQYLTAPRHVEVQILADQHGSVVAVGDRDCSLQRRHQKIIEEAPAIGLTDATRTALHQAAIRLAASVGYDSTGTVEFLVDWTETSRHAPTQKFYFLEMNTRLQVEHPVSEEVYGIDLVEWQLRVASGEALPHSFKQLTPRGHSIEVRLYAEDVRQKFFPSPGPVAAFEPALGPGLRWELGLDTVDEITGRFDPMFAKLIATGATREVALRRLDDGLARTVFAGPACNIDLLRELATASQFAHGPVTTHYLAEALPELLSGIDSRLAKHEATAIKLLRHAAAGGFSKGKAYTGTDPLALTQRVFTTKAPGLSPQAVGSASAEGEEDTLSMTYNSFHERSLPGTTAGQEAAASARGHGSVKVGKGTDASRLPFWYAQVKHSSYQQYWVSIAGDSFSVRIDAAERHDGGYGAEASAGTTTDITAPVPGKVITIMAGPGTDISEGTVLLVLESMKMEFEVKAAKSGRLDRICVKSGDQVTAGQLLAAWLPTT